MLLFLLYRKEDRKVKLANGTYDVLKWVALICVPALAVAYQGLAAIWGWPYPQEIATTANIVCTLLGALLGISTAEYNRTPS